MGLLLYRNLGLIIQFYLHTNINNKSQNVSMMKVMHKITPSEFGTKFFEDKFKSIQKAVSLQPKVVLIWSILKRIIDVSIIETFSCSFFHSDI